MPNFYYQLCLMSSGRLFSEHGSNLLDDNGAGPKRVKTVLPSEKGLMGLKVSNIWFIMMYNTFREPKKPNLVDIYCIKIELCQKGLKMPFLPK